MLQRSSAPTFSPHAHFEAFLQAAVLALVAVVLVHGTVPVGPARVGQVPPDAALEEALTSFTRELSVVFPAGFVPAHDALDLLVLLFVRGRRRRGGGGGGRRRGGAVVGAAGHGGGAGLAGRRCARRHFHRRVHVSRQLPGQRQRCHLGRGGGQGALGVPNALGVSPRHHRHIDRPQTSLQQLFPLTRQWTRTGFLCMDCSHAIRGSVASLQRIRYASKYPRGFLKSHAASVRPAAAWMVQIPNDALKDPQRGQATSTEEKRRDVPNRSQAAPFCFCLQL